MPTTVTLQFQADAGLTILQFRDDACPVHLELGQAQRRSLQDILARQAVQVEQQGGEFSQARDLRILARFKVGPKWHETDLVGARLLVAAEAAEGRDWVQLSFGRLVSVSERLISCSPQQLLFCPEITHRLADMLALHSSLFAERGGGAMGSNAPSLLAGQPEPKEGGP